MGPDEPVGARTLPRGFPDPPLERVVCERGLVSPDGSLAGIVGAIESNSSTELAFRSLTPDEFAASISGMMLWRLSILSSALF